MKKTLLLTILSLASLLCSAQLIPFATSQLRATNVNITGSRFTVAGTCIRTVTGGFSVTGSCLNSSINYNLTVASTCAGTIAGSNWTVSGVCLGTMTGTAYTTVAGVSLYRYNGTVSNTIYLSSSVGINAVAVDYGNKGINVLVSSFDLATSTVPTVTVYKNNGDRLHTIFSGTQTAVGGSASVTGASFIDSGNFYVTFSNGSIIMYSPAGLRLRKIK